MPATHEVLNQPPPLTGHDAFAADAALQRCVEVGGASWATARLHEMGSLVGDPEMQQWADAANRNPPVLKTHDRFGRRIDEVEFHPAWHRLLERAKGAGLHSLPWTREVDGAHVARSALFFLFSQIEHGVLCPISMTFSGVPVLRRHAELGETWIPRLTAEVHDPRPLPAGEKRGCLMGMAMTEKQGGSDVRANTTCAVPIGGGEYRLTGHKWFCSAPMSDLFLTLAQTAEGITCFLVPRWLPGGELNVFRIQRLKDKLGNKSNASAEIEYDDTRAWLVGEPGRGVATIIEMVGHTRLDCTVGSAGQMRGAVALALHHARHRKAFGKRLAEQPLMQNVLADLALESEAATHLAMRVARAFDEARADGELRPFARLITAIAKYWVCKVTPAVCGEALECHGGNGYVEEAPLARYYREAPLNAIWEGSGNVICLDVLRTLDKEPAALAALDAWLAPHRTAEPAIARALAEVRTALADPVTAATSARRVVERLAQVMQAALLLEHSPSFVAGAYLASRLDEGPGRLFGTLPPGIDLAAIVERASPPSAHA